jgi:hypothetical protein
MVNNGKGNWNVDEEIQHILADFKILFDRWILITMVCIKLHNICVDHVVEVPHQ